MNVSAVLVTRGDIDLQPVLDSLPPSWERVVWDNSERENLGVYGRYEAIAEASHPVVFVQDDDCVLSADGLAKLARAYRPNRLVANMPAEFRRFYPRLCLVGFGAVFDRDLPARAFRRFRRSFMYSRVGGEEVMRRRSDVVFAALISSVRVDVGYENLPHAFAENRNYRQPGHTVERQLVLGACRRVR